MPTVNDHTRQGYRVVIDGKARPLTVGDLKALLLNLAPGLHVKLWSDAEGNQINDLLEVQVGSRAVELVPFD